MRHLTFVAALLSANLGAPLPAAAQESFAGLKFGVGISGTHDNGHIDRISEAVIINGIVRVTETNNTPIRILLESHYFFEPTTPLFGLPAKQWGWGPFVAIQPGSGTILDAFAMGLMIGLKRSSGSETASWNLGIGLALDPKVKTLGDGFQANQPPPAGETAVRYTTRPQTGYLVMTSFSF